MPAIRKTGILIYEASELEHSILLHRGSPGTCLDSNRECSWVQVPGTGSFESQHIDVTIYVL